ncbi:SMP-30/gluconolactonase/LRE family protein [Sinorhizobium medicae]|uniref:SMP-30/gluconolactonase/LRE family protein n=1 Tax=Sinorhizobium medicae TaxID=110321 RepID=UPI000FDBAB00|nr:SMP-30/gluconolactonase/LRE family protein [Sinorhizobium medicae]RVO73555.1 SMP-30/gluconolactonase/LRE family protein [Sinorhizobium medicae]
MFGFAPPEVIKTEVFATVPQELRAKDGGPAGPNTKSKAGSFLEGPSFDRDGNLYVTDIPNGRVFRIDPKGEFSLIAKYDGEPNGLKIHRDGRILIADHFHGIMELDPNSGEVKPFWGHRLKERFKGPNDLVFASNGDLFFTDQGATGLHDPTGRVYRLTASGDLSCIIDTVPSPNGIILNKSENTIFVAATRAAAVWIVPLTSNGGVNRAGIFANLPSSGPDGMAADLHGHVAVAHPGMGIVWLYNRRGIPVARVESCTGAMVTNVAYGGRDNRWLYITESETGTVLRAEMPVAGRLMYSHM